MSKKMLIKEKVHFEAIKKMTTKDEFFKKFDVSMNVVSEVLAEDAMINLYFEDSRMATTDEILDLIKLGFL